MGVYKLFLVCVIFFVLFLDKKCQGAGVNPCGIPETPAKIPCDNSQCIIRDNWCNRKPDCDDGSDEKYCREQGWFGPKPDNHCTEKHFVCNNGRCIPHIARCDDYFDCSDDSDEDNCEAASEVNLPSNVPPLVEISNSEVSTSSSSSTAASTTTSTDAPSTRYATSTAPPVSLLSSTPPPVSFPSSTPPTVSFLSSTPSPVLFHSFTPSPVSFHGSTPLPVYFRSATPSNPYKQTQYNVQNYDSQGIWNRHPSRIGSDTAPSELFPNNVHVQQPYPKQFSDATYPSQQIPRYNPVTPYPDPTKQYSLRTIRNTYVERQTPIEIFPRLVYYPSPTTGQLHTPSDKPLSVALPPFHFSRNYTSEIGYNYEESVAKGKQWLIDQRDNYYTWGDDTPRALVALSLITNCFISTVADNDLMKKSLQTHLGQKIISTKAELLPITKLALYINALLATCQNPREFWGQDLVNILHRKRYDLKSPVSPFILLTLCLSNSSLDETDLRQLDFDLTRRFPDEISKDRFILAITAMACVSQQKQDDYDFRTQLHHLRTRLNEAVQKLIQAQNGDGSFGSIYTTSIAAQAIFSVNTTSWNPMPTLNYLSRHQSEDGSFGDMLSTYYSIPALSGRSLLHLRNTLCDRSPTFEKLTVLSPRDILDLPGPKKRIFYSLKIGYSERYSISMQLTIPEATNLFDMMRVAAYLDHRFKFSYKSSHNEIEVNAISNIPNDGERGVYWNLYVLEPTENVIDLNRKYTGDIKSLIPIDSQEILFWYLSF